MSQHAVWQHRTGWFRSRPQFTARSRVAIALHRRRSVGVMASLSIFLGLDVGTQGTKVLAYDAGTKEAVGRGSVAYSVTRDRPGQAEQAPSLWVEAVKDAIHDALEDIDPSSVRGIGVSGQQHGLVALDSELKVIRPAKLWCDVESAEEAAELSRLFGTTLVPSFTATKLLWMKRHEPDNFARLAHVLLPHDYINWWLTGRLAMEASDASGTGLFDSENRSWNEQRMTAIDSKLPGCFPELLGPQEVVGTLRPEVAKELGLPEDVLVSPGGGDNAMSALGAGAVQDGTWVLSLGTSGTLFGPSSKAVLDPSCVICPFCDATGKWLPLLCTINCTGVTEEVRFAFDMTHQEITSLAAKEPPGCRGAAFLPYLGGERTPNWPHATGAILGLRPGFFSPGLIYRAAMEGASFSLLAGMRRLGAYGLEAKELRVVGGGSNNQLWRRVLADTFQLPLRFPVEAETAALGAALQAAAVHAGVSVEEYVLQHPPQLEDHVVQPSHLVADAYNQAFKRFEQWGEHLFVNGGAAT